MPVRKFRSVEEMEEVWRSPGDPDLYRAIGEERDPDVLEVLRPGGTRFTLSEGETLALDLRLSKF